jgi:hypothetical protein
MLVWLKILAVASLSGHLISCGDAEDTKGTPPKQNEAHVGQAARGNPSPPDESGVVETSGAVVSVHLGDSTSTAERLIFAAYPDGRLIYSPDKVFGGGELREKLRGPDDVKRLRERLAVVAREGERYGHSHQSPHLLFTIIRIVLEDGRIVEYKSDHEAAEADGRLVATANGIGVRSTKAQRPETPSDLEYQGFRKTWGALRDIIDGSISE